MGTNAALGASGVSLALGLMNARGLSGLTEEVEKMKASMKTGSSEAATGAEDIFEIGDDLKTVVNDTSGLDNAVKRIDALEKKSTGLTGVPGKVTTLEGDMTELSKSVNGFEAELQGALFDLETIVDLAPDIQDLLTSWDAMSTKAGTNASGMFQAEDANLSLKYNAGDQSAYRFAGIDATKWCMYGASNAGKGPDGKAPPRHGKVTGDAIRVRVHDAAHSGFVVENSSAKGVFSVNGSGDTLMGNTYCGSLSGTMAGLAHSSKFGATSYAVAQTHDGITHINASNEKPVTIGNNGVAKVWVDGSPSRTLVLSNSPGTAETRLNHNGHNIFYAANGQIHSFRFGGDTTSVCDIHEGGVNMAGVLKVGGTDVKAYIDTKVDALTKRVQALESTQGNYVEFSDTVRLYNHSSKNNLGNDTRGPIFGASDVRARYSIVKD
jgi:hypothetical protein